MVRKLMTFSRQQKKISEANLTNVSTVDKEQQWVKCSPGISCRSNYRSRVSLNLSKLASVNQAD